MKQKPVDKNKKISHSALNDPFRRQEQKAVHTVFTHEQFLSFPFRREKGSYTVEAAVLLPFIALIMFSLLLLFRAVEVEQQVEKALIKSARQSAVLETGKNSLDLAKTSVLFYLNLKEEQILSRYVVNGIYGVSLKTLRIRAHFLEAEASYQMRFPVSLERLIYIPFSSRIRYRIWDGESMQTAGQDDYVYITPEGAVYHLVRSCTYLDPVIQKVSAGRIKDLRNQDGSKYYPCSCIKSGGLTYVYITKYGDRYHYARSCSSLKRNVRSVPRAEVSGRKSCRKCGV